ncbi:MAG: FecR domain-containing protein [Proteobacteria bacterium]|nr:FecR domain-containing protein [Pseudomonadota bacterium]
MTSAIDIEAQAAQWLAREDAGLTPAAEAARDAWLESATANRVAYLRLRAAWTRADRLAVLRGSAVPRARPGFPLSRRGLAACIAALALCGVIALGYAVYPQESYETPVGARETVHLADGSTMELNTNTAVRATIDETNRKLVLDHGEVYLQVVHDPARPFVVIAGRRRITDLGTKFSVRRDGDKVDVLVSEGRVSIVDLDKERIVPPVIAKRGTQVLSNADNTLVAIRSPQEVHNALGWRQGLLIFNQETLADAAAEFNRYNRKKLVVQGGAVADTRIGGSFDASNADAFARLMRDGFGFRVEDRGDEIQISQ